MAFDIKSCVFQIDNDPKGNIIKINKPVCQIFGYTRKELEGKTAINILMPRLYSKSHENMIKNYVNTGKIKSMYS